MLTGLVIGNLIINLAREQKIKDLTSMKLQKILYLIFGEYLVLSQHDQPLFSERFEAWKYGPILPSVYFYYKCCGAEPIDQYYVDSAGGIPIPDYRVESNRLFFLVLFFVWERYKNYTGSELSEITQKQSPWRESSANSEISNNQIKKYFQENRICRELI